MIIKMSYAEMSLLRELVKTKQLDIWRTKWLPRLRDKNKSVEELLVLFEEIMNKIMNKEEDTPLTDTSCCQKLLSRFNKVEQEIQKGLTKTKKAKTKKKETGKRLFCVKCMKYQRHIWKPYKGHSFGGSFECEICDAVYYHR